MGATGTRVAGQPTFAPDSTLLRLGATGAVLGIVLFFVATALHPGHNPANLQATLPEYAASSGWLAVHVGQFAGIALAMGGLVALSRSLVPDRPLSAALARLGLVAALVAVAVYAVNQAVDGVAIKSVADAYTAAAPADKTTALLVAQAVRHVELGLTSFFELNLGVALVLFGLAVGRSTAYPAWLGWVATVDGIGWVAVAVLLASRGFGVSLSALAMTVTYLLALWLVALAVLLWRRATRPGAVARPPRSLHME